MRKVGVSGATPQLMLNYDIFDNGALAQGKSESLQPIRSVVKVHHAPQIRQERYDLHHDFRISLKQSFVQT